MYAIYMVTFTINIPQMLAYIPAPWILWGMICSIAMSDYQRICVKLLFTVYFPFFANILVLSPFWRVSQDMSANGIRLLLADSVSAVFNPMKFHEIPSYSWFASHIFPSFSYLFIISPTLWWAFRNVQDIPANSPKRVPLFSGSPWARFINLINNEPTIRTLLPLSPTGMEDPEDETFKLTTEGGKLKVGSSHLWWSGWWFGTLNMALKKSIYWEYIIIPTEG